MKLFLWKYKYFCRGKKSIFFLKYYFNIDIKTYQNGNNSYLLFFWSFILHTYFFFASIDCYYLTKGQYFQNMNYISNISKYICGATKLGYTFNYKTIMRQYVPIIVHNCLIIVSALNIPTNDRYQQKIHQ
jgi:hypothetical protein